jgi:inhibitor of cysteine peptidase
MTRHWPVWLLSGLLLITLTGCDLGTTLSGVPPITTPGTPITVKVGQEFTITLHANATTGYQWSLVGPPDPARVALVGTGSRYVRTEGDAPGSGGVEIWTFKAVGAGQATITLLYSRPNDPNVPTGAKETFTVDVQ